MPRFTQCSWLGLLLLGAAPGMLPSQAPVGTRAPVVEVTDLDGTLVKLPATSDSHSATSDESVWRTSSPSHSTRSSNAGSRNRSGTVRRRAR